MLDGNIKYINGFEAPILIYMKKMMHNCKEFLDASSVHYMIKGRTYHSNGPKYESWNYAPIYKN